MPSDAPWRPDAPRISTLVIDDHAMVGAAIAAALEHEPGFVVAGVAVSVEQAVLVTRRAHVDVIVADLQLAEGEIHEHLHRFQEHAPTAKVLVMTGMPTERSFLAALRAGATGYVAKSQPLGELVRAVQRVADGELVVPHELVPSLLRQGRAPTTAARGSGLTARETEVLQLLALGRSTGDVAGELQVAVNTVRNHLASAMAKLGTGTRLAAVSEALRLGIVSPPVPVAGGRR